LRKEKNILFEEQSNDALPFLEFGGSRPKAVEGGCFPLQSFLYFSRDEKLSRKNKKLLYSDGRNCPEVFLDSSPKMSGYAAIGQGAATASIGAGSRKIK